MKKKNATYPLLTALAAAMLSQAASAAIVLYDKDDTTFSADGYINAFYVTSDVDSATPGQSREQSRIKMGFLPNYIGFNMTKQVDELKLGARSSFWVTINDSDDNATETGIDVRQFYGTVAGSWGEVLIGKDFGLFARSNIFLDELLTGYGQVSDTLGLVDGAGVSFGNIGTGYPYAFPTAQITYRSPEVGGLRVAVGVMDPTHTTAGAVRYEKTPRVEAEITYGAEIGGLKLHTWLGGTHQKSQTTTPGIADVKSTGVSYGVQAKFSGLSLTASGFTAEGLHPLFTNNAGNGALNEVDADGHLFQGSYTLGKNRVALSYGKTTDDGVIGLGEMETKGVALFHNVNKNLTLVAEYNQFERDKTAGGALNEETKTLALGAALNW